MPLVVLVLWLGVFPGVVMDKVSPSVDKLVTEYNAKLSTAAELAATEAEETQDAE